MPTTATSTRCTASIYRCQVGEVVTLIGANGAGKSTLMMSIFGQPRASGGRIVFDGEDITQLPTHEIARRGIALVPEGRRIFSRMTVLENLQMGAVLGEEMNFAVDLKRMYRSSRFSRNAASSAPGRCPAASSRCWRSPAR
jgi:ABC-type branched-subunit amino acid transport system ATPase component